MPPPRDDDAAESGRGNLRPTPRGRIRRVIRRVAFAPVVLCALSTAQTFIVDWRGGGHYQDLATAVASVPSGAVLRVRAGTYGAFTLAGKSLTILGDNAVVWAIGRDVVIGPTQQGHCVILDGLEIMPRPDDSAFHLRLRGLAGPTLLSNVRVGGAHPESVTFVDDCADLRLLDCQFTGDMGSRYARLEITNSTVQVGHCTITGTPSDRFGAGMPGLAARGSRVICVGSNVTGGAGSDAFVLTPPTGPGGAALQLTDSSLQLYGDGTTATGGRGGNVLLGHTGGGADGGPGLAMVRSTAVVLGRQPIGGVGGSGTTGNGRPGPPVAMDGGSGYAPRSEAGPGVRILDRPMLGGTVRWSLTGGSGDMGALLLGVEPASIASPVVSLGILTLHPIAVVGPFSIPAAGNLVLPVRVPLAWPVDAPLLLQLAVRPSAAHELWLSNPAVVIIRS